MKSEIKTTTESVTHLKIGGTDVFLQDYTPGSGKITLSGFNANYSYQWGAMGGNITQFLQSINSEYFANKLLGAKSIYTFDIGATFSALRKKIAKEFLPWYKHMEFQKEMRHIISEWQSCCSTSDYFVSAFNSSFVDRLPYHLIENRYERETIEAEFKSLGCEPWHLIAETETAEYKWLKNFHGRLKKELKQKT